jgi:hypothetical protein
MRRLSPSEQNAKLVRSTRKLIRQSRDLLARSAHLVPPADRERPAEEAGAAVTPARQDGSARQT